jgi:hypothetical protein
MAARSPAKAITCADTVAVEAHTGTPDLQRAAGTLRRVRILEFHAPLDNVSRAPGLIEISRPDESAGTLHR